MSDGRSRTPPSSGKKIGDLLVSRISSGSPMSVTVDTNLGIKKSHATGHWKTTPRQTWTGHMATDCKQAKNAWRKRETLGWPTLNIGDAPMIAERILLAEISINIPLGNQFQHWLLSPTETEDHATKIRRRICCCQVWHEGYTAALEIAPTQNMSTHHGLCRAEGIQQADLCYDNLSGGPIYQWVFSTFTASHHDASYRTQPNKLGPRPFCGHPCHQDA
ncbi:hypothetical protein B0T21DRAFT_56444 [Apiosordaria backusii]|uniref:Uncharacterized protein n=1 Tax=Apiosordaria backusii TaxID=314023 RepID=A0AA40AMY4_9PEZI|nr:hypothetical protein B0T21DRAFT_56444 [Apiosordaria backusii]